MLPLPIMLLMTQHLRRPNLNTREDTNKYRVPYLTQEQWTQMILEELEKGERHE